MKHPCVFGSNCKDIKWMLVHPGRDQSIAEGATFLDVYERQNKFGFRCIPKSNVCLFSRLPQIGIKTQIWLAFINIGKPGKIVPLPESTGHIWGVCEEKRNPPNTILKYRLAEPNGPGDRSTYRSHFHIQ